MSLETTVFTFKISVPFEEWAAVYDSEENIQMNNERGIVCLYKGVKKDNPNIYLVLGLIVINPTNDIKIISLKIVLIILKYMN